MLSECLSSLYCDDVINVYILFNCYTNHSLTAMIVNQLHL
jgi:hypothetical protein